MKKILSTLLLLVTIMLSYAQTPDGFSYQTVLRNSNGSAKASEALTVTVEILQGSLNGPIVFSEQHDVVTSLSGIANLQVGTQLNGIGTLKDIQWGSHECYMRIVVNGTEMSKHLISTVPYAQHAKTAGTITKLNYSQVLTQPDFTNWDTDKSDDFSGDYTDLTNRPESFFDGDYHSLTNQPITISAEASTKADLFSASSLTNLNRLKFDINANLSKKGYPGFGVTASSVANANRLWQTNGGSLFRNNQAGINLSNADYKNQVGLTVKGGVTYSEVPTEVTPGVLFYDLDEDLGAFCYYDNNGVKQVIPSILAPNDQLSLGDQQILDDLIGKGMIVGDDAYSGYQRNDNTLVFVKNIIRLLFQDTSNTASFPSNDWQLVINDIEENGANYFAIRDAIANTNPFVLMGGAPDHSLLLAANGTIGMGTPAPTEKLEVAGIVSATAFTGNGKHLTGLSGTATALVENTGSTTIGADNNSDGTGEIQFETNNSQHMTLLNNGKVVIGNTASDAELTVNGTGTFQTVKVSKRVTSQSIGKSIFRDTNTSGFQTSYDFTGKNIIIFNPTGGQLIVQGYSANRGQEITTINTNATHPVIINGQTLHQNESARFINTTSGWICTELVKGS